MTIVPAASLNPVLVLFSSMSPILSFPLILMAVRAVVAVVIATENVRFNPSAEVFTMVLVTGMVHAGVQVTVSPTLNVQTPELVSEKILPARGPDHRTLPALTYPVSQDVALGL